MSGRLFLEGRYGLRAEADVTDPKPDPVVIKAITDSFVIVWVDAEPVGGELPIRRENFERDYYLLPIFVPNKLIAYGDFTTDGKRISRSFTFEGDLSVSAEWRIDLSRVPEECYLFGWTPQPE